jgi:hypothetical protein
MVVTTDPVFNIPVKLPVVAEEVKPRIELSVMFNTPGAAVLTIPIKAGLVVTEVIAVFQILLLLILNVAVDKLSPWVRIHSNVPAVSALVIVIVLYEIVEVKVPTGPLTVYSLKIPLKVKVPLAVALVIVL